MDSADERHPPPRDDKQLEQRYATAGIGHLFFVFAVIGPGGRQRTRIMRYGDRAFGKGSFPGAPERPLGEEFDAWLAPRVRAALEGIDRPPPLPPLFQLDILLCPFRTGGYIS